MSPRRFAPAARQVLVAALAAPLLTSCWGDLVTDQSVGPAATPAAGAVFARYVAIGTSIGAGIQSGGINDSTQRQAYPELLALAMGHTLGVTFKYPSFNKPGCPPPFTNPLTGARVTPAGFPTSTSTSCYVRAASSVSPIMSNVSIPSIRAAQVLNLLNLDFGPTDTLKLATFITGGNNPIDMMDRARPTFVTLEVGANDVLGAATRGDAALLTDTAAFRLSFDSIVSRVAATGARVAVSNVPDVTVIPHFVLGQTWYALDNASPSPLGTTAAANLTVDASCVPSAFGGVGDNVAFPFATVATIMGAINPVAAGGANTTANINCLTGTATISPANLPAGATIDFTEFGAIRTNVSVLNALIADRAAARGWALVDLNAALRSAVAAGQIPAFPDFTKPTSTLFGSVVSLDGIHPNAAGHRIIAQTFATAIAQTYGLTLTLP
ncbi:MAG: hypothetical protein HYR48_08695 [Gemmatimonadetes bacterium]|nr:hypothetical protein [Gemmatimonadota bacterium]